MTRPILEVTSGFYVKKRVYNDVPGISAVDRYTRAVTNVSFSVRGRLRQSIEPLSDGKHIHGCRCCGWLQVWLLLLWAITTRPVVYETVRSCSASCRLTTARCMLDVVLLRETLAQPTMLVKPAAWIFLPRTPVPAPASKTAELIVTPVDASFDSWITSSAM